MKQALLTAAVVRKDTVVLEGQTLIVREVGTTEFAAYGTLAKKDSLAATAVLIESCVIDEQGEKVFNSEEARIIASTARMAMPLVNKIMNLSGFGEEAETKHTDAS